MVRFLRRLLAVHLAFAILTVMDGCKKEKEPFVYPEDPGQSEPEMITHLRRDLDSDEVWIGSNSASGCKGSLPVINYAYYNVDTNKGFGSLHLIPDSASCVLRSVLETLFSGSEIAKVVWNELSFEFTFSELSITTRSKLWIELHYNELELHLDLVPLIYATDSTIEDGLFRVYGDSNEIDFEINGKAIHPEFNTTTGNTLVRSGDGNDPHFSAAIESMNTKRQTIFVFNFLRLTSFGFPEQ